MLQARLSGKKVNQNHSRSLSKVICGDEIKSLHKSIEEKVFGIVGKVTYLWLWKMGAGVLPVVE